MPIDSTASSESASARPFPSGPRRACSSRAGGARSDCPRYSWAASGSSARSRASASPRMMRACFLTRRLRLARHRVLEATGMTTSRISTDWTVTPHGFDRASMSSAAPPRSARGPRSRSVSGGAADDVAQRGLRRPAHGCVVAPGPRARPSRGSWTIQNSTASTFTGTVSDVSVCSAAKLVVIVRWSIQDETRVDERHDPEEPRPAHADDTSQPQDDRALPLLGDPRRLRQHDAGYNSSDDPDRSLPQVRHAPTECHASRQDQDRDDVHALKLGWCRD